MSELEKYRYRGARALVLLHERQLRSFVATWRRCQASGTRLPQTSDPDYASMAALLCHVLGAARGYMIWMCEKLELEDPKIEPAPAVERFEARADAYLEHVLERWRLPLVGLTEEAAQTVAYPTRWGVDVGIESMLQHAVMHPMRHEFQLENL